MDVNVVITIDEGVTINEFNGNISPDRQEWGQNGFIDRTNSTLAFVNGTRTLTITPTGDAFYYYMDGRKFVKTAVDSIIIDDTIGTVLIYYDGDTLSKIHNPTNAQVDVIIKTKTLVADLYWNKTDQEHIFLGDERHGYGMSPVTHSYLHFADGLAYIEGLALNTMDVDGSGNDNSDAQFGIDAGAVSDEDLYVDISAVLAATGCPIWYMLGATPEWNKETNAGYSVRTFSGDDTTMLAYNQFTGGAWQLTQGSNNQFVLCHIFATTGQDNPMIAIMGQNTYNTIVAARAGANTEILSLVTGVLPLPELKPIATVIMQTSTGYSNDVKARVRLTDTGDNYVDWRASAISQTIAGSSHGDLSGLGADDHAQYLLVDGTRAMSGDLNMGNNNIINPGTGHDAFTDFVANEHIDHTAVSVSSGAGLTGGGTIAEDRTIALSHLGIEDLTDPEADRILFWDNSKAATGWLIPNTGLGITTTNLNVTADYSVISGNDVATDVTGAQLEELTDGSETTLHSHPGGGSGSGWQDDGTVVRLETITDNVNIGGTVDAGTNGQGVLVMTNGTAPTTSPANSIQLYAEDVSGGAAGGTITTSGGYTIHTFTSNGTFTPSGNLDVDYLIVAGGGGGSTASGSGGGGGGGGLLQDTEHAVTAQGYSIVVGVGGAAGTGSAGVNGGNSSFDSLVSIGGGGGGLTNTNGIAGGSGGGGGANTANPRTGGAGTGGQGFAGGSNTTSGSAYGAGGGGGASEVGYNGLSTQGGNGGDGIASSISGSSVTYAGGGGGGARTTAGGTGGAGGGGNGGYDANGATDGTDGLGGGGGGAEDGGSTGAGGSGVVIIRYLTPTSYSELKVRDEQGNVTILSPHHFSLFAPAHELAWTYHSEKDDKAIEADMYSGFRLLEELTGQQLIRIEDGDGKDISEYMGTGLMAKANKKLKAHTTKINALQATVDRLSKEMVTAKADIETANKDISLLQEV